MKLTRVHVTGMIAGIALALLVIALLVFKPLHRLQKHEKYYLAFDQIGSFAINDPLELNGMKIGYVSEIETDNDSLNKNVAKIIMEESIKIPENSLVRLNDAGSYTMRKLVLTPGNSLEYLENGDTLRFVEPGSEWIGKAITSLRSNVDDLIVLIDSTLKQDTAYTAKSREHSPGKEFSSESRVLFFVQIGSFSGPKDKEKFSLPSGMDVREYMHNGYYNYIVGGSQNADSAEILLDQIRKHAYKDAFIVTFYRGERIKYHDAMKLYRN